MSKKILDLTQLTTPATDDILAIRDTSAGSTKKITLSDVMQMIGSAPAGSVSAQMLATTAITLGYAERTTDFTTASTAFTAVTTLSVTVTIPAGGRRIRISVWAMDAYQDTAGGALRAGIWDGTVAAGTQISQSNATSQANIGVPITMSVIKTPAAGSKTYSVGFKTGAGTGYYEAGAAYPAYILVEAI